MTIKRLAISVAMALLFAATAAAASPQNDPIGYGDDFGLHTYVGNDPANKTDPTGRDQGQYLSNLGINSYGNGMFAATPDEAKGIEQGERALPGIALNFALDNTPIIGEGRAAINFYNNPTLVNAIIVGASLADLGGAARVAVDIGRLEKGAATLELRAAEHEAKAAEFAANPTVRPGMEGQPPEVVARQQAARIEHLRQEAAGFRKQAEERRALADELKKKLGDK